MKGTKGRAAGCVASACKYAHCRPPRATGKPGQKKETGQSVNLTKATSCISQHPKQYVKHPAVHPLWSRASLMAPAPSSCCMISASKDRNESASKNGSTLKGWLKREPPPNKISRTLKMLTLFDLANIADSATAFRHALPDNAWQHGAVQSFECRPWHSHTPRQLLHNFQLQYIPNCKHQGTSLALLKQVFHLQD